MLPVAAPAQAQVTRTWVSGTGNDNNTCSRASPCQTFTGALAIQVFLNNVRGYKNGTGAQFGAGTRGMIDQSAFDGNAGGLFSRTATTASATTPPQERYRFLSVARRTQPDSNSR